jgi:glycerol kinase
MGMGVAYTFVDVSPHRVCSDLCHELEATHGKDHLRGITGLPFSTYFSGVKVKWMYSNVLEVKAAMDTGDCMIGTIDSWLIYNLTGGCSGGVHVTDGASLSLSLYSLL